MLDNTETPDPETLDLARRFTLSAHLDTLYNGQKPIAVITGATGGIGRATVTELASEYLVVAQGRDPQLLAELEEIDSVFPVYADLLNVEAIEELFAPLPRVNALIHAAAIAPRFSLEDAQPADWERVFTLNVQAVAELTRALLPQLREATGTVVFLGSGASRTSSPHNVVYAASKHALQAVADGLRKQVSADQIRVTTVAPGYTDTAMVRWQDDYPLTLPEVLIQPATVARSIRHAVQAPPDTQLTEIWVRPRKEV